MSRAGLGVCLLRLGRFQEAEGHLVFALDVERNTLGESHERVLHVVSNLVELYEAWGKPDEAAKYRSLLQDSESDPP
jgi:serine/threonine-protein kinase